MSENIPEVRKPRRANVKQKKFVKELVRSNNLQQSYINAGYLSNNPDVAATNLLKRPQVQNELEKELDKLYPALAQDTATILQQMAKIAITSEGMHDKKTFMDTVTKIRGWEAPKKTRTEKLTADVSSIFKPPKE
jgi:phage terminase small subunit